MSEKQKIDNFKVGREMLGVQGESGHWDHDAYMHGLYNGMEFMLSLTEGRTPVFRDAPKKWKRRTKLQRFLNKFRSSSPAVSNQKE